MLRSILVLLVLAFTVSVVRADEASATAARNAAMSKAVEALNEEEDAVYAKNNADGKKQNCDVLEINQAENPVSYSYYQAGLTIMPSADGKFYDGGNFFDTGNDWFVMGEQLFADEQWDEAERYYKNAKDDYEDSRHNYAMSENEFVQAENKFNRALDTYPN